MEHAFPPLAVRYGEQTRTLRSGRTRRSLTLSIDAENEHGRYEVAKLVNGDGRIEEYARLFAAAPDLLAACEYAHTLLGDLLWARKGVGVDTEAGVHEALTLAIEKARGEVTA